MRYMENEELIIVEVAYATPDKQIILSLKVPHKTNVAQAIEQSGIVNLFDNITITEQNVGIFGKICDLKTILRAGDRVEIYRALWIDPKIGRRERANRT